MAQGTITGVPSGAYVDGIRPLEEHTHGPFDITLDNRSSEWINLQHFLFVGSRVSMAVPNPLDGAYLSFALDNPYTDSNIGTGIISLYSLSANPELTNFRESPFESDLPIIANALSHLGIDSYETTTCVIWINANGGITPPGEYQFTIRIEPYATLDGHTGFGQVPQLPLIDPGAYDELTVNLTVLGDELSAPFLTLARCCGGTSFIEWEPFDNDPYTIMEIWRDDVLYAEVSTSVIMWVETPGATDGAHDFKIRAREPEGGTTGFSNVLTMDPCELCCQECLEGEAFEKAVILPTGWNKKNVKNSRAKMYYAPI